MKKIFVAPSVKIVKLNDCDIIATSLTGGGNGNGRSAEARGLYDNDWLWDEE